MDPALFNFLDTLFLTLHNLIRWLVIIFAILALVRAYRGWMQRLDWQPGDNQLGIIFTSVLDLQVLLGLVLYFLFSPFTPQLFANFSSAMKTPVTAFYGVEHLFGMVVAMGLAHAGRAIARKAKDAVGRHKATAIWFTIAVLVILISIPWPFLVYGRPLFRLFGLTI
jgi:hypothetical protein